MGQGALSESLLSAMPEGTSQGSLAADSSLEEALASRLAEARAAWPRVEIGATDFMAHVGARLPAEGVDLSRVRFSDLYVACGCLRGDAAAVASLDERTQGTLRDSLRKMRLTPEQIDDVLQGLRRVLFAGDEVAPPRIGEYTGQGELTGWLRVSATRAALKLIRRDKREVPDDGAALAERATDGDPELHYMKALYRDAFKAAFQEALDSLDAREKNLLRQHVVDDLSIDELGGLYQVHRATAARWLAAARETLLARTRTAFMKRARVSGAECESVLRLVQSQLDATIRRRLEGAAVVKSAG